MAQVSSTPLILGMRDAYFNALYPIFLKDKKAVFISADNGAPSMDQISVLPGQFRNVGIAEEQMIGMACGLALEGRRVWVYAIDPFVTLRCLEFVKVDICVMNLPIIMLGVGAGYAYDVMGPTHHATGVVAAMRPWPNLRIYSLADSVTAAALAEISYLDVHPQYIRFDRSGLPDLYQGLPKLAFIHGFLHPKRVPHAGVNIIATGIMVHQALRVAEELEKERHMKVGVIDLFRLKPFNREKLLEAIRGSWVITLEEDFLAGGMGSMIAEWFADERLYNPLLRIGQSEQFIFDLGGREAIWKKSGLDVKSITEKILVWFDGLK